MASIGFGKNKQKSQTSGSNEVTPYAPTEGAIGEIINFKIEIVAVILLRTLLL